MSFRTIVSCASMSFAFALAGCGRSSSTATDHSVPSLHGRMMGGQQPVSGATIQLYTVGKSKDGSTSTPMITGTTVTTGADGGFTITGDYSCATSNATDVYITASGGDPLPGTPNVSLTLMAALGQCSSLASIAYININELTTVAAVAALHPYMSSITAIGSAGGDASALDSAFTVAAELVNIATGSSPGPNIPPGEMVPSTLINTFGDVVAPCINSASGAGNTPSQSLREAVYTGNAARGSGTDRDGRCAARHRKQPNPQCDGVVGPDRRDWGAVFARPWRRAIQLGDCAHS